MEFYVQPAAGSFDRGHSFTLDSQKYQARLKKWLYGNQMILLLSPISKTMTEEQGHALVRRQSNEEMEEKRQDPMTEARGDWAQDNTQFNGNETGKKKSMENSNWTECDTS